MPIGKHSDALAAENQYKLQETWSPEQIEKRRRMEGKPSVYFKTIYRWLYQGRIAEGAVMEELSHFLLQSVVDYEAPCFILRSMNECL